MDSLGRIIIARRFQNINIRSSSEDRNKEESCSVQNSSSVRRLLLKGKIWKREGIGYPSMSLDFFSPFLYFSYILFALFFFLFFSFFLLLPPFDAEVTPLTSRRSHHVSFHPVLSRPMSTLLPFRSADKYWRMYTHKRVHARPPLLHGRPYKKSKEDGIDGIDGARAPLLYREEPTDKKWRMTATQGGFIPVK